MHIDFPSFSSILNTHCIMGPNGEIRRLAVDQPIKAIIVSFDAKKGYGFLKGKGVTYFFRVEHFCHLLFHVPTKQLLKARFKCMTRMFRVPMVGDGVWIIPNRKSLARRDKKRPRIHFWMYHDSVMIAINDAIKLNRRSVNTEMVASGCYQIPN